MTLAPAGLGGLSPRQDSPQAWREHAVSELAEKLTPAALQRELEQLGFWLGVVAEALERHGVDPLTAAGARRRRT